MLWGCREMSYREYETTTAQAADSALANADADDHSEGGQQVQPPPGNGHPVLSHGAGSRVVVPVRIVIDDVGTGLDCRLPPDRPSDSGHVLRAVVDANVTASALIKPEGPPGRVLHPSLPIKRSR